MLEWVLYCHCQCMVKVACSVKHVSTWSMFIQQKKSWLERLGPAKYWCWCRSFNSVIWTDPFISSVVLSLHLWWSYYYYIINWEYCYITWEYYYYITWEVAEEGGYILVFPGWFGYASWSVVFSQNVIYLFLNVSISAIYCPSRMYWRIIILLERWQKRRLVFPV